MKIKVYKSLTYFLSIYLNFFKIFSISFDRDLNIQRTFSSLKRKSQTKSENNKVVTLLIYYHLQSKRYLRNNVCKKLNKSTQLRFNVIFLKCL